MSLRTIGSIFIVLLAVAVAVTLADKLARPAPQKYFHGTVTPRVSPRPYQPSLDDVYNSTDVPKDIPDGPNGVATSSLTISDNVTITDMNVMVTITHPWIRDLRISLLAPPPNDTIEVVLLDLFPGNYDSNLVNTWFDDESAIPIDSGAPPFTGRFRPQDSLSAFDGLNAQGTWTLRVIDQFAQDTGRIEAWAVEINRLQTLTGHVRDSQTQLPLSGVRVLALPDSQQVATDAAGLYGFDMLPAGTHNLSFHKACYDSIQVDSVVTTNNGQTVVDTALTSGGTVETILPSTSSPVSIPDNSPAGADLSLTVPETGTICDLDVLVNVTHSYVGDLDLWLISPHADTVQLLFVGDSCRDIGANIIGCRFDDEADSAFTQATAPFTGRWRPYGSLGRYDGTSLAGTWRLRAVDNCAGDVGTIDSFSLYVMVPPTVGTPDPRSLQPSSFSLSVYPNPFNAVADFRFSLDHAADAELVLYDLTGRRVATILNETVSGGEHTLRFDASRLPSGIYFARLSASGRSQSRKIVLLK